MWGGKQYSITLFSITESINFKIICESCPLIIRICFPKGGFVGQRVLKTSYKTVLHPYSHLGTWHKGH